MPIFLFLSIGPSRADDLGGRVILSYHETRSALLVTDEFVQNYDLRYQRMVTPAFQYKFFLRYLDTQGTTKQDNNVTDFRTRSFEPNFDINLNLEPFEFYSSLQYRSLDTRQEPGGDQQQTSWRTLNRITWRPENLPTVAIQMDRKTNEAIGSDTVDTDLLGTVDYTYKVLKFSYRYRFNQFDDRLVDLKKESNENQGQVTYEDKFWKNRLNITANYIVGYRDARETSTGRNPITVSEEVLPLKGLYSLDDTPLDATDRPMADTPALIDKNFLVSSGINIGTPGGVDFQNIGVDLGRSFVADQILVSVANPVGGAVLVGGAITWDVYVSRDGIRWTLVIAGTLAAFESSSSRYRISFPQTESQFFKVVTHGVNLVDTRVTEIQLFRQVTFNPGEEKTTTSLSQSGNLAAILRPLEKVTLTYNGYFNIFRDESSDRPSTSNKDWTQGLIAFLEPSPLWNETLQYQKRKQVPGAGQVRDTDSYSASINFFFVRNLFTTFTAAMTEEKVDGETSTIFRSFTFHNDAILYPNWNASLDLGFSRQEDSTTGQRTDTYKITGSSFAQLTKNLRWSLTPSASWSTLTGLIEKTTQEKQVTTEFFYRPNREISATVRWGYLSAEDRSGLTQLYRFDWSPFRDAAIDFTGTYEASRDAVSQQDSDRLSAIARWNINRYSYLEVTYNNILQRALISSDRIQNFAATYSLTL
jgi:hypothetical protein